LESNKVFTFSKLRSPLVLGLEELIANNGKLETVTAFRWTNEQLPYG
jgi:hypothetical protein